MWTNDDVIFALFILKANHYKFKKVVNQENFNDITLCDTTALLYADLFSDRAICEESMTRSEFNKKLHSFRLKDFKGGWNYERDFIPHMWE